MNTEHLVLVTGSAGRVGRAVVAELRRRLIRTRGFDLAATPGLEDFIVGDLTNEDDVRRAMAGATTVIHLAATPDDADFMTDLLPHNIVGVYHIMEAARTCGVQRIILASSGQVNWWQRKEGHLPVRTNDAPSPRYWYAACKMFMESIGRGYAETHGISVVVARLGWCPRTRGQVQEIAASEWNQDVYLSPGDAGRFFADAAEAPADLRFAVVYASSKPRHREHFDLEPARRLIGYVPQESWPEGVDL